jgi:hypothetical protein
VDLLENASKYTQADSIVTLVEAHHGKIVGRN